MEVRIVHPKDSRRSSAKNCGSSRGTSEPIIPHDSFDQRDCPRICGKDVPMPYAANLEKLALPNVEEVVQAAKAVCYR
jgi:pyruvate/2-oxoglutarate/acetoin dehydrogenase E1 component